MHNPFPPQPLVSIITPNYNGERFIRRVVESVRLQNYPVEHIIVDDCSTDGSWALLEELSLEYPWLKPVRLEQNSGPIVARNRAIELAQGRFLAFLDVDDFWLPHKLQTQIGFMLSKNCVLSFSDYRFVSEDGRNIGRRLQGFNQIGWHLHHMTRYLGCLTIVLDRERYPDFKIPNISSSIRAEDFLAWSACVQRHGAALRCPHDLARYAVVENSRSSGKKRAASSVWKLYRDIESILLLYALFYFIVYALGVSWKRYWNRPFMKRAEVDQDFEWSLLSETEKEKGSLMVCIVGGSGFIGTRLSQCLIKSGQPFNIVDKAPSRAFPDHVQLADVRNLDALRQSITDNAPLINLAAEHRDDVRPLSLYDEVNVGGARNLCTVAREKNIRTIVFTSTVAVYGFAPIGSDESGKIAPFSDYGRTKYEAEQVFKAWQAEEPEVRMLVIIRPTVVFGEQNRGNVYNLLRQIASGRFVMVGKGENRKSMAYVENVAALIEYSLSFKPGVHIYNYIDKPDFTMNQLVSSVKRILGQPEQTGFRLPYAVGYAIGKGFDLVAVITGKRLAISSIRVKKFCANSVYNTAIDKTGFVPPVPLAQALEQTIRHEFIEQHGDEPLYFSE